MVSVFLIPAPQFYQIFFAGVEENSGNHFSIYYYYEMTIHSTFIDKFLLFSRRFGGAWELFFRAVVLDNKVNEHDMIRIPSGREIKTVNPFKS